MKVLGLTGPTGAGKSTWAQAFATMGCQVIDCDLLARRAVAQPDCLRKLQTAFGADIVGADGVLDRQLLAARGFADSTSVQKLNSITHPQIRTLLKRQLEALCGKTSLVVIDAALLFEGGLQPLCHLTAAVLAPPELRLQRIVARDGITPVQARSRMATQQADSWYRLRADRVLDGALPLAQVPTAAAALRDELLAGGAP